MKKIILFVLFCSITISAFAQSAVNSDSVAYQLQRQKINNMLAARKQKFGQYETSLGQHTGIFGFQTKDDIRRSAGILMDIAKTDDAIFKELKILLQYRDFQQRQIQNHSKEAETTAAGYMEVINRLRQQNAHLKQQLNNSEQHFSTRQTIFIVVILFMAASILFLLRKNNRVKA
ncbi:hypothetical protein MTO98_13160 [Mucilaginibacter sp. SMC90]|uniref:hypothetical protein n=1 Tax=Mucilaginibacter sp. SMC90 TaxID=2929803 RepID=UPI001FB1B06B|nr:hypothetical protein [Mucilaginibacter sp. SMC90]UOE52029.1 hypothetical protein MTO98_13160 [Mucilaginibacter sp. SMC90]